MVGMHAAPLHQPAARGMRSAGRARHPLRRPRDRARRPSSARARRSSTSTSTRARSARSRRPDARRSRPTSATSLRALEPLLPADVAPRAGSAASRQLRDDAPARDARRATIRCSPTASSAATRGARRPPTRSSRPTSGSTRCGWRRRSRSRRPRQWLTSGGLGTMGFGLPAAIGAALASPGRPVVCFTGDGSLLMNLQELATAAEEGVDVKVDPAQQRAPRARPPAAAALLRRPLSTRRASTPSPTSRRSRAASACDACDLGAAGDADAHARAGARRARARAWSTSRSTPDENVYPMVPPGARQPRHDRRSIPCRQCRRSNRPVEASSCACWSATTPA